jgi:hypothetical protein
VEGRQAEALNPMFQGGIVAVLRHGSSEERAHSSSLVERTTNLLTQHLPFALPEGLVSVRFEAIPYTGQQTPVGGYRGPQLGVHSVVLGITDPNAPSEATEEYGRTTRN